MTKILCVDDQLILRKIYNHVLTKSGYEVLTAGDGTEALRCLEENPDSIDVVFTDFDFDTPEMDGLDLIRRIRTSNTPYKNVPIVICSGGGRTRDNQSLTLEIVLAAGANAYLKKPTAFDPEILNRTVQTYFSPQKD